MDFIDHEFISKHLGDFFAKSSIITITITIIIDVPRTARALFAVKNNKNESEEDRSILMHVSIFQALYDFYFSRILTQNYFQ